MQYNYDVDTCYTISNEIEKQISDNQTKKVAFIGRKNKKSKIPNGIYHENIGSSIFQIDWAGEYDRSLRIVGLMNSLGLNYQIVSRDEFTEIKNHINTIQNSYPKDGYIGFYNDIIVVRLDTE